MQKTLDIYEKKSRLMFTISNNSNKNGTKSYILKKKTVKRTVKQAFKIRFI